MTMFFADISKKIKYVLFVNAFISVVYHLQSMFINSITYT